MIDIRPVLHVVGQALCLLAALMILPAAVDAASGNAEWQVFAFSAGCTLFMGLVLVLGTQGSMTRLDTRQTFLAAGLGWLAPALFAALPLAFGAAQLSAVDALFEAVAGLTATNATVIAGLDRLPRGLLLWRGLVQWAGGIGFILMAARVLPALNIGGMQLFRIDGMSGPERRSRRAGRVGSLIVMIYGGLTAALALALMAAGMGRFDALIHAMTTISTGGYSTYDTSLGHFDSVSIDMIVLLGMVIGGMPFPLLLPLAQGNWRRVARDQQLSWYLGLLVMGGLGLGLWLTLSAGYSPLSALRHGLFTAVSVMTGTGFITVDFSEWNGLAAAIVFLLTFVGGCAGSATSGIKVFRFQLLFADAIKQVRQLLRPHAVIVTSYNRKPIAKEVLGSVIGFLFVYALSFAILAMGLAFLDMDMTSAITGAASAIANLGPGLGETIGPSGSYAPLPDAAKLLLAAGMLFGRLEMFVFLVVMSPVFWRR